MRVFVAAVSAALCLGACSLPTNITISKSDKLLAAQEACLSGNVAQFEDATSPPASVGRYVAMSCSHQTDMLIQHVIPHANAREIEALRSDAERRATLYVLRARGTAG